MLRIVLDTNCLLAVLPTKSRYHRLWTDFLQGRVTLCVSTDILLEYEEILIQKTSFSLAESVIKNILNRPNVVRVVPSWRFNMINADLDDNKFVDYAIAANADYIVSEDAHFNVLATMPFPRVNVLHLKEIVE